MMENESGFTGPVILAIPLNSQIRQLAELIIELTGSSSEIIEGELPVDDPTRRQPDIRLAQEHLQWEPKISLREVWRKRLLGFRTIDLHTVIPQLLITRYRSAGLKRLDNLLLVSRKRRYMGRKSKAL